MNPINSKLVESINADYVTAADKQAAARDEAEATYWAILKDPTRTSEKDKAALAAAIKTLGKSMGDVGAEAQALTIALAMAEDARELPAHKEAHSKAEAELREFQEVTRPKMQAEINRLAHEKSEAVEAALQRMNDTLVGLYRLRKHGRAHHRLAAHLPPEANVHAGVLINGTHYDPDKAFGV